MEWFRSQVRKMLARRGYRLQKIFDLDMEPEFIALHKEVDSATMTPIERQHALYRAAQYIVNAKIEGDIVECGVWKGGSAMLAARTLMYCGDSSRSLYLYDTFSGMSEPTDKDMSYGTPAWERWKERQRENFNSWDYAPLDEVKKNLASTGYPGDIHYVVGKVEDTIPGTLPEKIALLRLDTDWYESTRHELEHLFPRLSVGGVLIVDDYGHWDGAHAAVDEYFKKHDIDLFLNRLDYSGRIGVKVAV